MSNGPPSRSRNQRVYPHRYSRQSAQPSSSGTRFATRILQSIKKLNDKIKALSRKGHALPASRDAFNTTLKRERAQAELALAQEDLQRLMLRYDRSAINPNPEFWQMRSCGPPSDYGVQPILTR